MTTEPCPCDHHICWGKNPNHNASHTLNLENVALSYGKIQALYDISFSITCGHSLALIGPNGAGKSTLLKVLAGILPQFMGQIFWKGQPLRGFNKELAYLPQRTQVNWNFPITVKTLVEMGRYPSLGNFKKFNTHDQEIVNRALSTLGLNDLKDRQIGALSGGQQQRVFIARALAQEAHVLLFDEPFTGLDVPTSEALVQIFRQLTAEGRLLIASHHHIESTPKLFDKTLLLDKTQIAYGDTTQILNEKNLHATFHQPLSL